MPEKIVIIGAGGFGRHVLAILRSTPNWIESQFQGFLDDGEVRQDRLKAINAKFLGSTELLRELPTGTKYVVGIGNGQVRKNLALKANSFGLNPLTVIHPDSWIAPDAVIGVGSVICAGVRITTNAILGEFTQLNMNVTVGHDVTIDDYVTIFPQVAIGGESSLREYATLGAGATINPGVSIGAQAYIAAGAVVLNNVSTGVLVAGVPASFKKLLN